MSQLLNRICDVCGKEITNDEQIICEYCGNELVTIKKEELLVDEVEEKRPKARKRAQRSIPLGFNQIHPFDADLEKNKVKEKVNLIPIESVQIEKRDAEILQDIETQLNERFTYINNLDYNTKLGYFAKNHRVNGITLCNCYIKTLPESIEDLKSIEYLHLRSNHLKSLPNRVLNLRSLKELSLSGNELSTLPEAIVNLTSLEKLDISYNKLTMIPERIGYLTSLQELNLKVNQLKTLPESIINLISLQKLDLSHNRFLTLPESLQHLSKLKNLLISGNIFLNQMDRKTRIVIKLLNQKGVSITK